MSQAEAAEVPIMTADKAKAVRKHFILIQLPPMIYLPRIRNDASGVLEKLLLL